MRSRLAKWLSVIVIFKVRNDQKIARQGYTIEIGIRQHIGGRKIVIVGLVAEGAVGKLPQNRQPGAGSADREYHELRLR